jgi:hypothetical protein
MKRFVLGMLLLSSAAMADDKKAVSVEGKAAKGVTNHEPVDAGDSFAAGDVVWLWTRVQNGDGTKIVHVWKKDGKEDWRATLDIGSTDWRTNSRRQVSAGSWAVEIDDESGAKLGEVDFTVK